MKNIITILALATSLFVPSITSAQQNVGSKKILVAYYSYSGNTKKVAEDISRGTKGNIFEIKPKKAYPSNYNDCVDQASAEIKRNFRPELESFPANIGEYDIIFVGSPNWWGTMAPPLATFMEKCGDLKGKTIVPFFTHGGGGMQNCERDIKALAEKAGGRVLSARTWYGSSANSKEVRDWATAIK